MVTGSFPVNEIDHRDQDKDNNRFDNLRDVTRQVNSRNHRIQNRNKTGVTGVFYEAKRRKYRASIRVNYKTIHLGRFDSIEDAAKARAAANLKYGFSPNHGIKRQS